MDRIIPDVQLTSLKIINTPGGDVLHGMKNDDPGFAGFGEAYFSIVNPGTVKGWKRHKLMTLNLVVCFGKVRFVIYDDRRDQEDNLFQEVILSSDNYSRLTVPPMMWMGFQGVGTESNMLLNMVDIEHSAEEIDRLELNDINFNWEL